MSTHLKAALASYAPRSAYLKKDPQRSVAVLIVHGIGEDSPGYAQHLQRAVNKLLGGSRGNHNEHVRWNEVYWAGETRANQYSYLHASEQLHGLRGRLNWERTRNLVLTGLGDAAAYQLVRDKSHQTYHRIQSCVQTGFEGLLDRKNPLRPVIIIGHSTGSHIASTFIYDTLRHGAGGAKAEGGRQVFGIDLSSDPALAERERKFLSMQTLAGFITLGSNLPMFSFALKPEQIVPIAFPEPFASGIEGRQKWFNMFYRADILGYPIRPICEAYANRVDADIELTKRFRVPSPIPPLSLHKNYWRDERVADLASRMILDLITAPKNEDEKQMLGELRANE